MLNKTQTNKTFLKHCITALIFAFHIILTVFVCILYITKNLLLRLAIKVIAIYLTYNNLLAPIFGELLSQISLLQSFYLVLFSFVLQYRIIRNKHNIFYPDTIKTIYKTTKRLMQPFKSYNKFVTQLLQFNFL